MLAFDGRGSLPGSYQFREETVHAPPPRMVRLASSLAEYETYLRQREAIDMKSLPCVSGWHLELARTHLVSQMDVIAKELEEEMRRAGISGGVRRKMMPTTDAYVRPRPIPFTTNGIVSATIVLALYMAAIEWPILADVNEILSDAPRILPPDGAAMTISQLLEAMRERRSMANLRPITVRVRTAHKEDGGTTRVAIGRDAVCITPPNQESLVIEAGVLRLSRTAMSVGIPFRICVMRLF